MIARYYVDFKCGDNLCHTTGESTFPTVEQYSAKEYSLKKQMKSPNPLLMVISM